MSMVSLIRWWIVGSLRCGTGQINFLLRMWVDGDSLGWVCLLESVSMQDEADKKGESMKRKAAKQGTLDKIELRPFDELSSDERMLSPFTGNWNGRYPHGTERFQYDV